MTHFCYHIGPKQTHTDKKEKKHEYKTEDSISDILIDIILSLETLPLFLFIDKYTFPKSLFVEIFSEKESTIKPYIIEKKITEGKNSKISNKWNNSLIGKIPRKY